MQKKQKIQKIFVISFDPSASFDSSDSSYWCHAHSFHKVPTAKHPERWCREADDESDERFEGARPRSQFCRELLRAPCDVQSGRYSCSASGDRSAARDEVGGNFICVEKIYDAKII